LVARSDPHQRLDAGEVALDLAHRFGDPRALLGWGVVAAASEIRARSSAGASWRRRRIAYRQLMAKTREVVGGYMHDAWKNEPITDERA
jgi:hypothetical protein